MNFVDFVIDCYSHIISHVSQAFASCIHYTSYFLLNIVHVIVCVFGLTNKVCKYFEFLCKTILMLENLNFGKTGFKLCFWKTLHHILIHFVHQFQCFEVFLKCVFDFFKTFFFLKNFVSLCPFRLIQFVFSINRKCFKIFKEASVCFDQSKLIFDQSKLVN